MQKYVDYMVEQAQNLLGIDSPTGYTRMAATYVIAELMMMDVEVTMTKKGGVLACLNPEETLSEGQLEEIDRVYKMYPHLNDDAFVADYLKRRGVTA